MTQRLDHGPFSRFILLGLCLSGLYTLLTSESETVKSLPNWFDNLLGVSILVGAGLCLAGSYHRDWRVAYRW